MAILPLLFKVTVAAEEEQEQSNLDETIALRKKKEEDRIKVCPHKKISE